MQRLEVNGAVGHIYIYIYIYIYVIRRLKVNLTAGKFIAVSDNYCSYRTIKFIALPVNLATVTCSGTGAFTVRPINPLDLFKTDKVLVSQY